MKLKKWFNQQLNQNVKNGKNEKNNEEKNGISNGLLKLTKLRMKINNEHHKLIHHVEKIFSQKHISDGTIQQYENGEMNLMKMQFPLKTYIQVKKGLILTKVTKKIVEKKKIKTKKISSKKIMDENDLYEWSLSRIGVDPKNEKKKIKYVHFFRYEMKKQLDEIVQISQNNSLKPFLIQNGLKSLADDFELISFVNVLHQMKFIDKLQIERNVKEQVNVDL